MSLRASLMPFSARVPLRITLTAAVLAVLGGVLAGCGQGPQQAAPPPPTVTVAKPIKRTIVDQDEYVGRFVAVDFVEVRARVSGYLDKIHFQDGQIVKQGDLLFTIDQRPFQNTLAQARANLAQAHVQSDLHRGRSDARRATRARPHHHRADLRAAHAGEARRRGLGGGAGGAGAPGRARSRVHRAQGADHRPHRRPARGDGNLVTGGTGGNTTLLAIIVSIDPIRFEFTFDEASFLRYERLARQAGQT